MSKLGFGTGSSPIVLLSRREFTLFFSSLVRLEGQLDVEREDNIKMDVGYNVYLIHAAKTSVQLQDIRKSQYKCGSDESVLSTNQENRTNV